MKIPLHGLLLQISFHTPVQLSFFFFSFPPRDFLRRHYRSVAAFILKIGRGTGEYSARIKARNDSKYDRRPAKQTCFSWRALIAGKTVSYGKEILLPCIIDNYCRLTYGTAFKMKLTFIKRNRRSGCARSITIVMNGYKRPAERTERSEWPRVQQRFGLYRICGPARPLLSRF